MADCNWHDYLLLISFLAGIGGILLVLDAKKRPEEKNDPDEQVLLLMSFTYWLVYCLAVGFQKLALPEWEMLVQSVKLTGVISYLLTWSCIVTLPLYRFAVRYVE